MTRDSAADPDAALAQTLQTRGTAMLVGPDDSGKSTFALTAANAMLGAGLSVAVIDADVSQAEIGPPGCISIARPTERIGSLTQLTTSGMHFVGDIVPSANLLSVVLGTETLARRAQDRGVDLILVDTSGLVTGRGGERLKLAKIQALKPDLIIHFRRGREGKRLADLMRDVSTANLVEVACHPFAQAKSTVFRRARRERGWAKALEGATLHEVSASQVRVLEAWPFTGVPMAVKHLKFASEALRTEVVYGEETADGVCFCVVADHSESGVDHLKEEYGHRRVILTRADWFQNLFVGLSGEGGRTLGVGLVQGINFSRGILSILTSLETVSQVRQIVFGRVRVRPEGSEIDRLRPGDL